MFKKFQEVNNMGITVEIDDKIYADAKETAKGLPVTECANIKQFVNQAVKEKIERIQKKEN